jgi:hypothetical protein
MKKVSTINDERAMEDGFMDQAPFRAIQDPTYFLAALKRVTLDKAT